MSRTKAVALVVLVVAVAVGVSAIWWAGGGDEGSTSTSVGVYITPESLEAEPGQAVTVNVEVNPEQLGVSGGRIHLEYDPSALEVAAIEPGYFFGPTPLCGFKEIDEDAGVLGYALARVGATSVPSEPGVFAAVTFNVLDSAEAGTCDLTLKYMSFCDEAFEDIEGMQVQHGSVVITH